MRNGACNGEGRLPRHHGGFMMHMSRRAQSSRLLLGALLSGRPRAQKLLQRASQVSPLCWTAGAKDERLLVAWGGAWRRHDSRG